MTVQLFNSLFSMISTLSLTTDINSFNPKLKTPFFSNKFVVKHDYYNAKYLNSNVLYHNIKCWKSNCIFYNYIEDDNEYNLIYLMDFNINRNNINDCFIKIDYLFVDDNYLLKTEENKIVIKSLIKFIENWAIKEKINKIIIDVHNNLERYNNEFKELGFVITYRQSLLNPYWFIAEKFI